MGAGGGLVGSGCTTGLTISVVGLLELLRFSVNMRIVASVSAGGVFFCGNGVGSIGT